jgi:xanthosine utilization system XapX-like protein
VAGCFAFIAAVVVVAIIKIPVIAAPALALWVVIGIWLESRWPS